MKRFFWGLCCPVMSCEQYVCEAGIPLSCAVPVMGCVDTNGAREGFWGRGDPWELDSRRIWLRLPWWFMGLNPGGSHGCSLRAAQLDPHSWLVVRLKCHRLKRRRSF